MHQNHRKKRCKPANNWLRDQFPIIHYYASSASSTYQCVHCKKYEIVWKIWNATRAAAHIVKGCQATTLEHKQRAAAKSQLFQKS
jgi:hypothetical protein